MRLIPVPLTALALLCSGPALAGVTLTKVGSYSSGLYAEGGAEIVAHDPDTQRLFVTNGGTGAIDIIDISDETSPTLVSSIDLSTWGVGANSVDVKDGVVVAAVEDADAETAGQVVFFDTDGTYINHVEAGVLPDMVTFNRSGRYVVVANEGEPLDDYAADPEGSVTIVDLDAGVENITSADVTQVDFSAYNGATLDDSVRVFGPGSTAAQDFEPEYVTTVKKKAYVTLQENNAIAIINLKNGNIEDIVGLGFKDHNDVDNAMDASNKDGAINIANWPTNGMYQPDAIVSYKVNGDAYLITANEGDAREYGTYTEEARVKDLTLDPTAFPDAAWLQDEANLGRLKITTTLGDTDNDGDYDELYNYGARSFSIWDADGNQVFDSGSFIGDTTAALLPDNFNSDDEENGSFDDRSDDKGAEPEGLAVGKIHGTPYLFLGLERVGGIMVFDISDPTEPEYQTYINTRDFDGDPELFTAGDMSPEGLKFIKGDNSPTGSPMLAVGFEVSGTTVLFDIDVDGHDDDDDCDD